MTTACGPFPALYEVSARDWIGRLRRVLGRPATFDDIPDAALDALAGRGFDWLWLLGVWTLGPAGRAISRAHPGWVAGYRAILPDCTEDDVTGSPFAVAGYDVSRDFGGDAALARLRKRLRARGIRLMLDFVPNHTAPDHPWVQSHPEYYVAGTEADLAHAPENYARVATGRGTRVLAFGRDPYFSGWPDTLQLDYRSPAVRQVMGAELARIAGRCDGVRCDMAMLLLPEVFARTWSHAPPPADGPAEAAPFWPGAIAQARAANPDFRLLAEVYWDLEGVLQDQGFDATYDKRLYDRLRAGDAGSVRGHLHAGAEFQQKSLRFLENHDEERAADAFPGPVQKAAAVVTFLVPGSRLFHEGQLEGHKVRASVHLGRRADEPADPELVAFYARLLRVLGRPEVREGTWRLLEPGPAWEGNPSHGAFLAFQWEGPGGVRLLVAVNYAPTQGQCLLNLAGALDPGGAVLLRDLLGPSEYRRDGAELVGRGLYLDLPAWGLHAFEVLDTST